MIKIENLPQFGLYVHFPWCIKKCPYCDFNSHNISTTGIPEQKYLNALITDLENSIDLIYGRKVSSIFFGGGTPSLISGEGIGYILTSIRNLTNLSPYAEITIEANPGAIDKSRFDLYATNGVNRISIGIQSFNEKHLKSLGRIHGNIESFEAINLAKKIFEKVNLDIIYGLPNQTIQELEKDVNIAIDTGITHLSFYNLTIEPNTQFYHSPPTNLPDNDLCFEMQELINEKLTNNGYVRYETSAYTKNNTHCIHNLNYWNYGDYLGIGAGAHSKLSFSDKIIRQVRNKHPNTYLQKVLLNQHIIEQKIVNQIDIPFEFMMNALRLIDGFNIKLFSERTGLNLSIILEKINKAVDENFLEFKGTKIIPTKKGVNFLNDLLLNFL